MKKNVAVLCGGKSPEREISLKSGQAVFENIDRELFTPYIVDIADNNKLIDLIKSPPDVVFLALHGKYGEDGTIQGLLEYFDIKYTGSGIMASSIAINKAFTKRVYLNNNIKTPEFLEYNKDNFNLNILKKDIKDFGYPLIIKGNTLGSTIGTYKVINESELEFYINEAFLYDNKVIIEKFIEGIELTVGIIGANDLIALPVIEIVPKKGFFDYEAKYTDGAADEIVPARISIQDTLKAQEIALKAHKALNCYGISRTDIILSSKDNEFYVLETNTCPGLTSNSLIPKAAKEKGISLKELITMLINWALIR